MNGPVQVIHTTAGLLQPHLSLEREANQFPKSKTNLHQHITSDLRVDEKLAQPLNKKVEVHGQEKLIDPATSDSLPTRLNHRLTNSHISATKVATKQCTEKVNSDPNNFTLRCDLVYHNLLMAEICQKAKTRVSTPAKIEEHSAGERLALGRAKWECEQSYNLDSLNARYYNSAAMIMELEGVDCKDLARVEKYLELLKTALAIDPHNDEVKQTLDEAEAFLRKKWAELEQEGTIEVATRIEWTSKLEQLLGQNALKELFRKNLQLFKLSSNVQYAEFFRLHPELSTINAFVTQYPELKAIRLSNRLTKESMREALAQAENDPFATEIAVVNPTAILTPVMANEIKEGMIAYSVKQKALKVFLGNQDDVETIHNSFISDKTLVEGKGTLRCEVYALKGESIATAYAVFILLDDPFVKGVAQE